MTVHLHTRSESGHCNYCRIAWPCSFERGYQAGLQAACLHLADLGEKTRHGEVPEGKPDVMMVVALISDETRKYLQWAAALVGKLLTSRVEQA